MWTRLLVGQRWMSLDTSPHSVRTRFGVSKLHIGGVWSTEVHTSRRWLSGALRRSEVAVVAMEATSSGWLFIRDSLYLPPYDDAARVKSLSGCKGLVEDARQSASGEGIS